MRITNDLDRPTEAPEEIVAKRIDRQRRISRHLDKTIRLPSGTEAAFADVMAVSLYQDMQRQVALRRAKKK